MATDSRDVAEQIEACIRALARLGVEAERGVGAPGVAETVRAVAKLLDEHETERAKPALEWWTNAVVRAVAKVYRDVQAAAKRRPKMRRALPPFAFPADEYKRRLQAALAPFGIEALPAEIKLLALSSDEIKGRRDGAIEAAQETLGQCLDAMLARRGRASRPGAGALVSVKRDRLDRDVYVAVEHEPSDETRAMGPLFKVNGVAARTLQDRMYPLWKHGEYEAKPAVTEAEALEYLAELSRGIVGEVERARALIRKHRL